MPETKLVERSVQTDSFHPEEPETLDEAGISEAMLEALICKLLFSVGDETGRGIARSLGTPGKPTIELLARLKNHQYVYYRDSASMGDFRYALTEAGQERARKYIDDCSYVGPCPVPLDYYIESVSRQTIAREKPVRSDLDAAFNDLLLNEDMLNRLGPAINSGRGLFVYGAPGNGKTSIAERITDCFGTSIWVPHAIVVDGEIIKFYDPENHQLVPDDTPELFAEQKIDRRWIKIRRPTLVVGGELTMAALELQHNVYTKITEPSVQLKSNCGTLVIDDFGRQRMPPDELLNRWIVPLEKRYDYLSLSNGKKIQVPFDQLIIFSTNLEPRDLVDDAFLRRIPYKIHVRDPSEQEYRHLMKMMAAKASMAVNEDAIDHLIDTHYKKKGRGFRCCHPRDLIAQIVDRAAFDKSIPAMTTQAFDHAADNYFAIF
ncbi:MAG: AAA family ATPase [Phycisphaerae bacterium]